MALVLVMAAGTSDDIVDEDDTPQYTAPPTKRSDT